MSNDSMTEDPKAKKRLNFDTNGTIEKILDKRIEGGKVEYKLKWAGNDTVVWENEDNLPADSNVLKEWKKQNDKEKDDDDSDGKKKKKKKKKTKDVASSDDEDEKPKKKKKGKKK